MPLSAAAPREPIHRRQIECRGYRRADGLWDIEGHLIDIKSYAFQNEHRGEVAAGEPIHEMWLRIGKGFINKVRELLGGVEGCTHLVEMVGPVATTAFQTIFPYRNRMAAAEGKTADSSRKPRLLNTCHAFAENGPIAQRLWPELKAQPKG